MTEYAMTDKKLIVIKTIGGISELGGITGPVINPFYCDIKTINVMLSKQRIVFEVNPNKRDEMIRLTLKNLRIRNFNDKMPTPAVANVAPKTEKKSKSNEDLIVSRVTEKKEETKKSDFVQK